MPASIRRMAHLGVLAFLVVFTAALARPAPGATHQEQAREILKAAGAQGGLIIHLGCGDGKLTAALRRSSSYLVQGLDADASHVAAVRAHARSQGLGGCVSAAQWTEGRLPYVDGLVNLVVIERDGSVPMDEVMRVLAPGGVACVRRGAQWVPHVKPRPGGLDDWSHHMYNATGIGAGRDTVVGQPRSMQWKAGPEYGRSHENMASVSAVVSAGGRVFAIMDEGPAASIYLPAKWFLSARDAFSGVLLWKVPIREWHARLFPLKSGPQQLPRRLVATKDKVYVTLGLDAPVSELDAATGKVLRTFDETAHAEELLNVDGRLVVVAHDGQGVKPYAGRLPKNRSGFALRERALNLKTNRSVMLVDTVTGKVAWKTPPGPVVSMAVAAEARRVFYLYGRELVCADMANGRALWATSVARKAVQSRFTSSPTLLVHKGVVYLGLGGKLTAWDGQTGRPMWSAACAKAGYQAPPSLFIVNGLIWDVDTGGEPYRPGSDPSKINRVYIGYDLRTGEVRKELPASSEHGYAIMHHRCHIPRASGSFIITSFPGIEFFNVKTGTVTHDSWIRGACLYGFMPANGLLYTPPHPCACYTQGKLTGFWAVAGDRKRSRAKVLSSDRLQKGPAFARTAPGKSAGGDWPTYRGDAARSGITKDAVPQDLTELWSAEVGEGLGQCVIADGRLFVTSVNDHTVHALDATGGKRLWHYTAGGRVDSPPTAYRGTVVFGSRDGYVYCLTADKGELAWRFRGAVIDERSVAYGQVESVWPVHGSVLLQDDVLWFCAGRSSFLDGGLVVYRLDPRTGRVLSVTKIDSLGPKNEQPPITSTMYARLDMEGAKNDVLSSDGAHVFMRHWAFDANGKSVERNIDHLFSPTGFLDASWFRRTYWIYGQTYVSGAQGWARTGNVRPTGRILSIDEDRIYGFGRNFYPPSPGAGDQMYLKGEQEVLFASARTAGGTVPPPRMGPPARGERRAAGSPERADRPAGRSTSGRSPPTCRCAAWSWPGRARTSVSS